MYSVILSYPVLETSFYTKEHLQAYLCTITWSLGFIKRILGQIIRGKYVVLVRVGHACVQLSNHPVCLSLVNHVSIL